jgi:hypothetical protein
MGTDARCGKARAVKKLLGVFAGRPRGALQDRNGCAQMRRTIVEKFHYEGVLLEHFLDDTSLNAPAAAVDEPDLRKSGLVRFVEIFLDHGWDVARSERVKVERVFDGNAVWVLILHR